MTIHAVAVFAAAFMAVNGVFFHALQGPTSAGRIMAENLREYGNFFSEVEGDPISRMNSADRMPPELDQKIAYAIAFNLDLGWGQQFVTSSPI
jgi:hypothetical protein